MEMTHTIEQLKKSVARRSDPSVFLAHLHPSENGQVVRRALRRMILRRELWNRKQERFRKLFDRRPEENIIRGPGPTSRPTAPATGVRWWTPATTTWLLFDRPRAARPASGSLPLACEKAYTAAVSTLSSVTTCLYVGVAGFV